MSYPTKYTRQYDYVAYQNGNPTRPLPADKVNADLNQVALSTDEIVDFLKGISRSDGALANGAVTYDSLSPSLQTNGIASASAWATGIAYTVGSPVVINDSLYRCAIAHTSGVFATDLAAGKWAFVTEVTTGPEGPVGPVGPVGPQGPAYNSTLKSYATLAAAIADEISEDVDVVETLEREAGKGGGWRYSRIATTTDAAWRFTSADGQMWSVINSPGISPEVFGVFEGEDSTAAWDGVEGWLNLVGAGLGGATLDFKPGGAVYDIWDDATTPVALMQLQGASGITVNFNGAQFRTNNQFTPQGSAYIFIIYECSDITINGPRYEQTGLNTLEPDMGGGMVFLGEGVGVGPSKDITINHGEMIGGRGYFFGASSIYTRVASRGVFLNGAKLKDVYYGIDVQATPDSLYARGIECDHVGRGYFVSNASNHTVELIGNGGDGHDFVLLNCYAIPTAEAGRNVLSNIDLTIRTVGMKGPSGVDASRTLVDLCFQQQTAASTPAEIRNITIRYDVEDANGNGNPPALVTSKYTHLSVADTTTRNYVLENVVLTGSLKDYDGGINVLNFFTNTGLAVGDFTGERINNVGARDLVVSGTNGTVLVNATDVDSFMPFENVSGPAGIVWTVTDPSKKVRPSNTAVNGMTDHRAVVPSVAVSNQFVTGIDTDGALTRSAVNATTITNDTTSATMYPVWVTANTGNLPLKVTSTKFVFNPALGSLGIGTGVAPTESIVSIFGASMTGASQFALNFQPTFTSSVNAGNGIYIAASTQAAVFTAAATRGIWIDNVTKGAGSTITSQQQLVISAPTQGSSTNYAINNLGGRNYFGGGLALGADSDPGAGHLTQTGGHQMYSATAVPAGGTTGSGLKMSSTANLGVFFGSGAPSLSAAKGSLYLRTDGTTTNDRMYVNTNGTTTWTAVTTVA